MNLGCLDSKEHSAVTHLNVGGMDSRLTESEWLALP